MMFTAIHTPKPRPNAMRRLIGRIVLILALLMALAVSIERAYGQTGPRALVLYDQPMGAPYQNLGKAYAIMLANLLGHWDARIDLVPAHRYQSGATEGYEAIFYLGAWFDHPLPQVLLEDLSRTERTVVWFKYNFWQLARVAGFDPASRWGFRMVGNRSLEGDPSAAIPDFFDTVHYKGATLRKYFAWSAPSGSVFADPDIGQMEVIDPTRVETFARIENRARGEYVPYALRSGNVWYVADTPFSYIGPRDRYLVFADLLHEILGESEAAKWAREAGQAPAALVRFEDVHALTRPEHLATLADTLAQWVHPVDRQSRPIPFSIALIPRYRDPFGRYNSGRPQDIRLRQAPALVSALNDALGRGGALVMHGYTHQYFFKLNPYSAVSGDDFEFWDIVGQRPLSVDSPLEWRRRIDLALRDLRDVGLTAFAFETPHYQASPNAYRAIAGRMPTAYERAVYYTSERPRLGIDVPDKDFAVGQLFPYVIARDWYGRKVLPENLGNIEYDIRDIDPTSNYDYTWQDLLTNAQLLRTVVRNGVASFFFHPFWLETFKRPDGSDYPYDGLADLRRVLEGVQQLGYEFVDPRGL